MTGDEHEDEPKTDRWEQLEDKYFEESFQGMTFRLVLLLLVNATVMGIGFVCFAAGVFAVARVGLLGAGLSGFMPFKISFTFAVVFLLRIMASPDDSGRGEWTLMILAQLVSVMVPVTIFFKGHPEGWIAAWVTCVIFSGMLATGMWLLHSWRMNRWARQMYELKAENESRRAGWDRPPLDR